MKDEVDRHRPRALAGEAFSAEVVDPEDATLRAPLEAVCRALALGRGEAEALSLMERVPEALFLTDDAAARLVAVQMGYRVHGTVGILIRSVRRHQKTAHEALEILRSIPTTSSLHIRHSLLEDVMQTVKRELGLE